MKSGRLPKVGYSAPARYRSTLPLQWLAFRKSKWPKFSLFIKTQVSQSNIQALIQNTPAHKHWETVKKRTLKLFFSLINLFEEITDFFHLKATQLFFYDGFCFLLTEHLAFPHLVNLLKPLLTTTSEEITLLTSPLEYSPPLIRECMSFSFKGQA